jgi:hypothetical protein
MPAGIPLSVMATELVKLPVGVTVIGELVAPSSNVMLELESAIAKSG